ncbi:bifunctional 2-polyprenyl-6-hydroxyphenol methylase/3-demethylubiquinol 3-O-methyltransferase UbiG [Sphingopyxis sp. DBS4]|uniref:class I SAM-dependent methyltransferase n=1 Tax=Sphingopyxis sp. DBS4 TaxID=2968500 RepID=UPI00214D05D5|nr:class I SAM-dependent methyltransferase [Sphingopyxis sp. DBS4]
MSPPQICPLCQEVVSPRPIERGSLRVYGCKTCGLHFGEMRSVAGTRDAGSVETSPHHFSNLLAQSERLSAALSGLIDVRMATFRERLGAPPRHWLEIGPGSGLLSAIVERHGGYWRGCEIEPNMAKNMAERGLDVVQADFAAVDPRELFTPAAAAQGGFDIVFLSQVFEHVRSPDAFLRNAWTALRPGGLIYIDVPNDDGLTAVIRRWNRWSEAYGEIVPPFHMLAYGANTLAFGLRQAGFEGVSTRSASYDDPVFGLAHARIHDGAKLKAVWKLSHILAKGGNLTAIAQKPLSVEAGDRAPC